MGSHPKRPLHLFGRSRFAGLVVLLLVLSGIGPALAQPGLNPASVEALVFPGESIVIDKTVHTPEFPPQPDIMFLADTTGSMGPAIANVKANATAIMNQIAAVQPQAQFGAAEYRDFNCSDPFAYRLNQALTSSIATAQAGINQWITGNGCDIPEAQLNALFRLATEPVGFRPDPATRIIVWFGDANGHNPSGGHSLPAVISALQARDIMVIAVPVITPAGNGLNNGGQASAITTATGGQLLPAASSDQVAAAILSGLSNLPVNVSMASDCAAPISTSFDPASRVVTSGDDADFTETISVAAGAAGGTYQCSDWALLNGEPMVDDAGNIIYETKTIHVPGIELTPELETNELGTPGQTHTVTATITAGDFGPVAGVRVEFEILSGPNAGETGEGTTDAAGQVEFTYVATQGPAGLGLDLIEARFTDGDDTVVYGSDTATKDWVDTTPPDCDCLEGPNPSSNVPSAPGQGGQGQNQDGFYELVASDAVWPDADLDIFVVDSGSGTIFGPFAVGTVVKYTQVPGGNPDIKPGTGEVDWKIKGTGDMQVFAVDGSGNASTPVDCLVPPPPQ
ncbi:hypothetical protein BH23CHL2_BH23CHL2_19970 [soil metagenome]